MNATSAFTFCDAFTQLSQADLGHQDRTDRLLDIAQRISQHPEGTLPDKLHSPPAYRAALRLMNQPSVTHQSILEPHRQATLQRLRDRKTTVLLVHDLTDLDYSNQKTLALGPIGNGGGQGYLCHNSLAVDPNTGELLGLVNQILQIRQPVPQGEGVKAKRERKNRESRLWYQALEQIGQAPPDCHWVDVCDRGADTFEMLEFELKHQRSFVIRSCHNRALELTEEGSSRLLHDVLRSQEAMISWEVTIRAQPDQEARTARVSACWRAVRVRPPHVHRGEHGNEPLSLWALRVWEEHPPEGVKEPLEWFLLTDRELTDAAVARQVVREYECRPRVEDFHKGQKTGLSIEKLQLQSRAGLEPMIALLSILAVALVNLREAARDPRRAERPAVEYYDPLWVQVLSLWRHQEVRPFTVREFTMALARLGGHQNRKCDGLPGWITLWRGMMRLQSMVEYELSRQVCGKH